MKQMHNIEGIISMYNHLNVSVLIHCHLFSPGITISIIISTYCSNEQSSRFATVKQLLNIEGIILMYNLENVSVKLKI
jgi:hypothetical protein